MYQSIDDPQDELAIREPKHNRLIWLAAMLGLMAVVVIVYWTSPGVSVPQNDDDFLKAELATYRKAISEVQAPMRRARLQDFLTTYPNSARTPSVEAQLDVIRTYEASEWIDLTDIVYDPKNAQTDKITALDTYVAKWGGALLGSRTEEIQSIRDTLTEGEEQSISPSRKLKDQKSPIPKDVPDSILAGGPRPVAPPPVFVPPVPIEPAPKVAALEIIPPKIRRNVNPRYPRRAMRADIEAVVTCLLYTSPSPRDATLSRMPSSA